MANFYIADLHLEHANVIRFDSRPFCDKQEMFRAIKHNWNERVTDDDTVYILGDFIWLKEPQWADIVKQLKGKKVLIRGNHDPKEYSRETRRLFVDIREMMEITDSGKHVIMSHYPMPCYKGDYNPDCYMLYGHVHNTREAAYMREMRAIIRKRINGTRGEPLGQFINVGCMEPYMNYTPRTLNEIIQGDTQYYPAP
jgi:calcineurin-like phosphoesterase family protein